MGRVAAEMLLDKANGLNVKATRIKVECELVVRASTQEERAASPVAAAG
jgi:DNA-binding LacI/PurR family transcriptional regulator